MRYEGLLEEARRLDDEEEQDRALARLHRSKDEGKRLVAVELLATLEPPGRFELLTESLGDDYGPVRRKAVHSLERSRDRRAVEVLVARLAGATEGESFRITPALGRMTGLPHGASAVRWRRWWAAEGATYELPDAPPAAPAGVEEGATRASFYGLPIHDEHVVFAVDTSDSMKAPVQRTDGSRRIDVAKEQLRLAIEAFAGDATFDLIDFGKTARSWKGELVEAKRRTKKAALDRVDDLRLSWGTEVHGGLRRAFQDPSADSILFLTDGDPQLSVLMDRGAIQALVRQWNRTRHTTIDCLSIGRDRKWLKALAEDSGGRYRVVR